MTCMYIISYRLFPPITSDATRNDYKRIFNEEYQEYLDLKGQIEVVTNEVTALSEQLAAVKKGTEEAKVWQHPCLPLCSETLRNNSIVKSLRCPHFRGF